MTLSEFKETLNNSSLPKVAPLLEAMWYVARGDREKSHTIAPDVNTKDGSWIHAYLHRKEGDQFNAQYWYTRANRPLPTSTLEEEWSKITQELLAR